MPVPAIIGAIGAIGSNAINNGMSGANAEKAFERQKELMALQQQYAVENWSRENNYNTPAAQKARLKAAGLNPDLMYGNGAAGLQAGSVAAPTAPSAPMAQTVPMGNPIAEGAAAAQGIAAAKKAGAETVGQVIENEFLTKTLQDRVRAVALQNNWTEQQTNKAIEETANLQQQYGLLVAQQNILSTERQIRDKQLAQIDERFEKEMRAFDDQHNLSHEEYRRLRNTYDDFVRMMKANADDAEWKAKMDELLYNSDADFKNWERSAGLFGQFIGMITRLIKLAK